MDASNLLKPALARGDLHCVGATTLDEYRKRIEKDAPLARRFQSVYVAEPSVEDIAKWNGAAGSLWSEYADADKYSQRLIKIVQNNE